MRRPLRSAVPLLVGALFALGLPARGGAEGQSANAVRSTGAADLLSATNHFPEPWPEVPTVPEPEIVADGLASPCGLAVGTDGLYLAEERAGRVLLLPKGGGPPIVVIEGLAGPTMLALAGNDILITQQSAGTVDRISGGIVTRLADGQTNPRRIRTDGLFAYWVANGTPSMSDGAVRRVPIAGGAVQDLATNLRGPTGLALSSDRCYFTVGGASAVEYVPLDGGTPVSVRDSTGYPYDVIVDEAAGQVYWGSPGRRNGGWIFRANLDLAGAVMVSFSPPAPLWLALDTDKIYWSTYYTLTQAARAGGPYEDIVFESYACDFVLAEGMLTWTSAETGRVLRAPAP